MYQIHGALEDAKGTFLGFRVLVCDLHFFDTVDVPAEVLDIGTAKYLQFRLKLTKDALDVRRLPYKVQRAIREPLGRWLDRWVLENFYGNSSNKQSTDP